MKITKLQIKKIIQEEIENVLEERSEFYDGTSWHSSPGTAKEKRDAYIHRMKAKRAKITPGSPAYNPAAPVSDPGFKKRDEYVRSMKAKRSFPFRKADFLSQVRQQSLPVDAAWTPTPDHTRRARYDWDNESGVTMYERPFPGEFPTKQYSGTLDEGELDEKRAGGDGGFIVMDLDDPDYDFLADKSNIYRGRSEKDNIRKFPGIIDGGGALGIVRDPDSKSGYTVLVDVEAMRDGKGITKPYLMDNYKEVFRDKSHPKHELVKQQLAARRGYNALMKQPRVKRFIKQKGDPYGQANRKAADPSTKPKLPKNWKSLSPSDPRRVAYRDWKKGKTPAPTGDAARAKRKEFLATATPGQLGKDNEARLALGLPLPAETQSKIAAIGKDVDRLSKSTAQSNLGGLEGNFAVEQPARVATSKKSIAKKTAKAKPPKRLGTVPSTPGMLTKGMQYKLREEKSRIRKLIEEVYDEVLAEEGWFEPHI